MIDKKINDNAYTDIEYEFTKSDLIAVYENDLKKPLLHGCLLYYLAFQLMTIIFGGLLMFIYFLDVPAPVLLLSILAIPVICVLLVVFFSRRRRATRLVNGRLKRGEIEAQYFGRHRLELKEDGIELRYGTICMRRQYAGIQKISEYPGGIMVYSSQLDRNIIPYSAFVDAQQRGEFLNYLQARISQAKNVGITKRSVEDTKQDTKQDTNYVLTYTWDEADFIAALKRASRLVFKTRLAWTRGQIVFTLFGLLFCIFGLINFIMVFMEMNEFYREGLALLPGGMCFGVGLGCLSPLLMAFTPFGKTLYTRQIDSGAIPRDFFEPQSLCLKEDRITEQRTLSSFDVMYDRVYCVRYDADGMCILLKDKRFFIIPNSAFHSDEQKREIADYIKKKIKIMLV